MKKNLSIVDAIFMNINMMVGVGAFFGPQLMTQKMGAASFLGWIAVTLIFLPIVLSVAALTRTFPGAGSFYSYSKNTIGKFAGFFSGWMFLIGYAAMLSLQARCFYDVVGSYVPLPQAFFNMAFIGILCFLMLFSIKAISRFLNVGTFFKMIPLLFVFAIFGFYWNPQLTISLESIPLLPLALPVALTGFWGFECCCTISHLIKGDTRNASRAVLIAFFITATIYTFFHLGLLHIMGPENLATYGTQAFTRFLNIGSPAVLAIFNNFITTMISLAYVISMISVFIATSETLNTLAREDHLIGSDTIARINKNNRPVGALVTLCIAVFFMATFIVSKDILIAMSNIGILTSLLMAMISLIVYQVRNATLSKIIVPGLAIFSWIILALFSWNMIGTTNTQRLFAAIPLITITLGGVLMFGIKNRKA